MEQSSQKKPSSRRKKVETPNKEKMVLTDPDNEHKMEIGFGEEWINIRTSTVVKLQDYLVVQYTNGPITLKVDVSADFNTIPAEYHEIFLNIMASRYIGKVNFGDNPFSQCKPVKVRKWYQFWKSKYFTS